LLLTAPLAAVLGCPQLLDDSFDTVNVSHSDAGASCAEAPCPWALYEGGGSPGGAGGSVGSSGSAGVGSQGGSGGSIGGSGSAGSNSSGGASGSVGGSGSAGSSSGSSGGGSAGTSGGAGASGGAAGDTSGGSPCVGCLALRVSLTEPNDEAFFNLDFGQPGLDLHDTVATLRLRATLLDETGQLFLQTFATDADFTFGQATFRAINAATFTNTETFIDVPIDVAAISTSGFDPLHVVQIGVQFVAGALFVGPVTAELLVDSITFTGSSGLEDLNFNLDAQGFAVNPDVGLQTAEVIHH